MWSRKHKGVAIATLSPIVSKIKLCAFRTLNCMPLIKGGARIFFRGVQDLRWTILVKWTISGRAVAQSALTPPLPYISEIPGYAPGYGKSSD